MKKVESSDRSAFRSSTTSATTPAWSEDNLAEIEKGWIKKGNSLEDIAAQIDVNPKVLRETVDRWNDAMRRKRKTKTTNARRKP